MSKITYLCLRLCPCICIYRYPCIFLCLRFVLSWSLVCLESIMFAAEFVFLLVFAIVFVYGLSIPAGGSNGVSRINYRPDVSLKLACYWWLHTARNTLHYTCIYHCHCTFYNCTWWLYTAGTLHCTATISTHQVLVIKATLFPDTLPCIAPNKLIINQNVGCTETNKVWAASQLPVQSSAWMQFYLQNT